jgi:Peroxiredoxin
MHSLIFLSALALAQPPGDGNDKPKTPLPKVSPELAAKAKRLIDANPKSEGALMASAILNGSQLGPGEGWFKTPTQKKLGWEWLARRYGVDPKDSIEVAPSDARSPLAILDRDGDGWVSRDDFDWSPNSPWIRQQQMASAFFRVLDADGSGRISENEWRKFFAKANKGKSLTQESLQQALFPPEKRSKDDADGPPAEMLLKGFFAGELGCIEEGPKLGQQAPDFELKTTDGEAYRLSQFRGERPVVIVFGSFT